MEVETTMEGTLSPSEDELAAMLASVIASIALTRLGSKRPPKLEDEVEQALLDRGLSLNTSPTNLSTPFTGSIALTSKSGTSTSK